MHLLLTTMEQSGTYRITVMEERQSDKLIPESQIREITKEIVKQVLAEMLGLNNTYTSATLSNHQVQWHDTEVAYSLLGLNSAEQLRIMVRDDTLRIGIEVRDVRSRNSQIPRYQFHIEKCEARLSLPPEKRSPKKRAAHP